MHRAGMTRAAAFSAYGTARAISHDSTIEQVRAVFPNHASLVRFANDVGQLTWPGSYGQSPWDDAYSIAQGLP